MFRSVLWHFLTRPSFFEWTDDPVDHVEPPSSEMNTHSIQTQYERKQLKRTPKRGYEPPTDL